MGAENRVTSCGLQVFVDEAAEPVSSLHADGRSRTWQGSAYGRPLVQGSVRSVGVEVLDILAQNDVEVTWSGDQKVVEALAAQGAELLDILAQNDVEMAWSGDQQVVEALPAR